MARKKTAQSASEKTEQPKAENPVGEHQGRYYATKKLSPGNRFSDNGIPYVVLSSTVVRNNRTNTVLEIVY